MTEIWEKSIEDDSIEIGSMGGVRSTDRFVNTAFGAKRRVKGQIIKPFYAKSTGYLQINLSGRRRRSVHRLVALAFCDGYFEGAVVNHKNGQRNDNRAENLEWVTQSENMFHSFRELGRVNPSKGSFGEEHSTSKAVIATCIVTGEEYRYGAAMDAVREGFLSSEISRCCAGKIAYHKGFTWRLEAEA